mmetsp:Transcript_66170/g.138227  ORF Transcript_66170/g.138227 Transcript_66170/m.138227 type:complete len:999 (-) Transcript_66170:83-3079(-)
MAAPGGSHTWEPYDSLPEMVGAAISLSRSDAAGAEDHGGGHIPLSEAGLRSSFALLMVLLQTLSALGLGYLCVRHGAIDVQQGDMKAVQFYISRIALPLLVFKIVATSSIGSVNLGVLLACSLGKMSVYILTFCMSFCAYRSKDPFGKRMLTATVFAFFTTASNDLAIGFPVIHSIYGDKMSVYVAANVLIFQTVIQPMAMVLFEVGEALAITSERPRISFPDDAEPAASRVDTWKQRLEMVWQLTRSIILNPVMLATIIGAVYSQFFAFTMVKDDNGNLRIPEPVGGIIDLWTSPFAMMFLFLNGTALRSASVRLWPVALVLMKVLVCAYISFGLSHIFVSESTPGAQNLRQFTFFYGTIPAGGAPLIYAQLFDSGVEVIAGASIGCLMLAGPVEFITALFLGTSHTSVNYADVKAVLLGCARTSAVCSAIFVAFTVMGWWGGSFASRAIGVFGFMTLIYELWTLLLASPEVRCNVDGGGGRFVYRFLQNTCCLLVVYLEYHMGTRWKEGRRARSYVVTVVVLVGALIVTLLVPTGNAEHELCGITPPRDSSLKLIGWNALQFFLVVGLGVHGRVLKQRVGGNLPMRRPRSAQDLLGFARPLLEKRLSMKRGRSKSSDWSEPDQPKAGAGAAKAPAGAAATPSSPQASAPAASSGGRSTTASSSQGPPAQRLGLRGTVPEGDSEEIFQPMSPDMLEAQASSGVLHQFQPSRPLSGVAEGRSSSSSAKPLNLTANSSSSNDEAVGSGDEGLSPATARGRSNSRDFDESVTTATQEAHTRLGGDGIAVATCLVVLQGLRSFMGAVNLSAQALASDSPKNKSGFTPMLILEVLLEHGHGLFLLLAVIVQPGVLASTGKLVRDLAASGCCQGYWGPGAIVEVGTDTPHPLMASTSTAHLPSSTSVPEIIMSGRAPSFAEVLISVHNEHQQHAHRTSSSNALAAMAAAQGPHPQSRSTNFYALGAAANNGSLTSLANVHHSRSSPALHNLLGTPQAHARHEL